MSASGDRQLEAWMRGEPHHNTERDECCPDFSCCEPRLLWPPEQRQEFAAADEFKRHEMLMGSMGAMLEMAGKRDEVYVAGMDGEELQ